MGQICELSLEMESQTDINLCDNVPIQNMEVHMYLYSKQVCDSFFNKMLTNN